MATTIGAETSNDTAKAAAVEAAASYRARMDLFKKAGAKFSCATDEFSNAEPEKGVNPNYGDHGIGPYEFWGAKGVHRDVHAEPEGEGEVTLEFDCEEFPTTGAPDSDVPEAFEHEVNDTIEVGPFKYFDGEAFGREVDVSYTLSARLVRFSVEQRKAAVRANSEDEKETPTRLSWWHVTATYAWEVER